MCTVLHHMFSLCSAGTLIIRNKIANEGLKDISCRCLVTLYKDSPSISVLDKRNIFMQ